MTFTPQDAERLERMVRSRSIRCLTDESPQKVVEVWPLSERLLAAWREAEVEAGQAEEQVDAMLATAEEQHKEILALRARLAAVEQSHERLRELLAARNGNACDDAVTNALTAAQRLEETR